jgi:two-component system, OmpR family, KDP operon response regulator KdpE
VDLDGPGKLGSRNWRELRALSDMVVILLAASAEERDKIDAFLDGADDYITKPFNMPELLARIHAVLRSKTVLLGSECNRIRLDCVEVDFDLRCVRVHDHEERLTPKEFSVLHYLAMRPNKTVAYRELLRAVWGPDYGGSEQCLRSHIAKLRAKIEKLPNRPKHLLTVPWVGYRLQLPK